MQPKTAVCRKFLPLQAANVAYFQKKIRLSGFSAYPYGSSFQVIRISGVLLYFFGCSGPAYWSAPKSEHVHSERQPSTSKPRLFVKVPTITYLLIYCMEQSPA